MNNLAKPKQTTTQADNNKNYFSISNIPHLTNIAQLGITITQDNVTSAYKSNKTLSATFTNTKDPIDKQQQHNVVYEIGCTGNAKCEQACKCTTKRALEEEERYKDNTNAIYAVASGEC